MRGNASARWSVKTVSPVGVLHAVGEVARRLAVRFALALRPVVPETAATLDNLLVNALSPGRSQFQGQVATSFFGSLSVVRRWRLRLAQL